MRGHRSRNRSGTRSTHRWGGSIMWSSADISRVVAGNITVSSTGQKQTGRERLGAAADGDDLGAPRHLAGTAVAAELDARLEQGAVAVQAAGRELAAAGRDGQLAVERDAPATLDEGAGLVARREAERPQPLPRVDREAVVDLGHVDVRGLEVGARPEHLGAGVETAGRADGLDGDRPSTVDRRAVDAG